MTASRPDAHALWGGGRASPGSLGTGAAFLSAFGLAAVGVGLARAITTTYLPVLLDRIDHAPELIGLVMLVNAAAGFAVPLLVGLWSDRARAGRMGRRLPFMVGGTVVTAGGLVAIALGTASSYAVLALAATVVYLGLNATATAHRAIVGESFEDRERPAATSAQELAMLAGAMAGILAGGALIEASAWTLFALTAFAVPLLAAPTVVTAMRRSGLRRGSPAASEDAPRVHPRDFIAAMRRSGPREILLAQILWVMAYAALPTFFILYADAVLGLGAGAASLLTAGFAVLTAVGMLVAGRQPPERVYPVLLAGAAMLGVGMLAAAPAESVAAVTPAFAIGALGAGIVTALGFPYFARFIPAGQSGSYSGLYFSVRAIASGIALPVAGFVIAATGSYRALLVQGVAALIALVPLIRAERRARRPEIAVPPPAIRPIPRRVAAVIPCYSADRLRPIVAETLTFVDEVVLVDDGSPPHVAEPIEALRALPRVRVLRLEQNSGKGDAVAAGVEELVAHSDEPDAIVVLDADGQHPPAAIPSFAEAAGRADIVIGDRTGDRDSMPRVRRFTNRASSLLLGLVLGRRLPDTQCGMRLFTRDALGAVPLQSGRYEAETLHLRAAIKSHLGVAWVPIPAIYDHGPASSFRPVADTIRIVRAIFGRPSRPRRRRTLPNAGFWNQWGRRLGIVLAGSLVVAALMPFLGPLDERLFLAIHSLGLGPDWVYQALDPHTRNYVILGVALFLAALISRSQPIGGVALAIVFAALFSDLLVQGFYEVYDRPRPEEVLAGQFLTAHDRSWAHIESFPSGHLVVTTAVAVAGASLVPGLRGALCVYLGAVALTRITFGAHFPLDVVVGAVFGYEVGRFSAALPYALGMLRLPPARLVPRMPRRHELEPIPADASHGERGL